MPDTLDLDRLERRRHNLLRISAGTIAILLVTLLGTVLVGGRYCYLPTRPIIQNTECNCPVCPKCPEHSSEKVVEVRTVAKECPPPDLSICPRGFRHCATCHDGLCLTCKPGYSGPDTGCFTPCATSCATCSDIDPDVCTSCSNPHAEPPTCYFSGECHKDLENCDLCETPNKCLSCKPGFTNPAGGCQERCSTRCAECDPMDANRCVICADEKAALPGCYPSGVCDPSSSQLEHCLECEGYSCVTCKPGYSNPDGKCMQKCNSRCEECHPHEPSLCITCADGARKPPICRPYGECDRTQEKYNGCLECDDDRCLSCTPGRTNPKADCTDECSSWCMECAPDDAKHCTHCRYKDMQLPSCRPASMFQQMLTTLQGKYLENQLRAWVYLGLFCSIPILTLLLRIYLAMHARSLRML
ncbi:High cysteine membrane protein [Giardia muris]|uniref:High cysteine membrane protein n=1 Tax=Giardia muris TaxID=5742 RepID=A0A4Z1T7P7_GIAMU|nr:High cysteine membrane protein [Giardia muris]|eukprot:TNJ29177.1 High cysteine membrane protein [Giardia muris]